MPNVSLFMFILAQAEKLIFICSMARLERKMKGDKAATSGIQIIDDFDEADLQAIMEADMAEELGRGQDDDAIVID